MFVCKAWGRHPRARMAAAKRRGATCDARITAALVRAVVVRFRWRYASRGSCVVPFRHGRHKWRPYVHSSVLAIAMLRITVAKCRGATCDARMAAAKRGVAGGDCCRSDGIFCPADGFSCPADRNSCRCDASGCRTDVNPRPGRADAKRPGLTFAVAGALAGSSDGAGGARRAIFRRPRCSSRWSCC